MIRLILFVAFFPFSLVFWCGYNAGYADGRTSARAK